MSGQQRSNVCVNELVRRSVRRDWTADRTERSDSPADEGSNEKSRRDPQRVRSAKASTRGTYEPAFGHGFLIELTRFFPHPVAQLRRRLVNRKCITHRVFQIQSLFHATSPKSTTS